MIYYVADNHMFIHFPMLGFKSKRTICYLKVEQFSTAFKRICKLNIKKNMKDLLVSTHSSGPKVILPWASTGSPGCCRKTISVIPKLFVCT